MATAEKKGKFENEWDKNITKKSSGRQKPRR
jgi:hypothetical protein